jgi:hypothetical protein
MNLLLSESSECTNWQKLYRAAILEVDPSKLSRHIAEAEKALIQRARELFQKTGDNIEEEQDLDDAMYALHAFRSTLKYKPAAASQGESDIAKVA